MQFAARTEKIEPFYVMEVAKAAQALAAQVADSANPMIFLNIGEPDFTAAPLVQQAAQTAIAQGQTQYTSALGLPALRTAIGQWYADRFGVQVDAGRIVVTAGASAALQLACLALVNAGDEVLMPDPSYPCNRHFVSSADGVARLIATTPDQRYQLTTSRCRPIGEPKHAVCCWPRPPIRRAPRLHRMNCSASTAVVQSEGGSTIVDEIYLGLSYEEAFGRSALALSEDIISINSFSKYFSMTGWRLGWMVSPPAMVPVVERLAQNLFICPSTIAQHAASACFAPRELGLV